MQRTKADQAKVAGDDVAAVSDSGVTVFHGTIVDAPLLGQIRVRPDTHVGVSEAGVIVFILGADGQCESVPTWQPEKARELVKESRHGGLIRVVEPPGFICPGFIDTHAHAPQSNFAGSATDLPLMEWLQHYTFPAERSLDSDPERARTVMTGAVRRSVLSGTTTSLWWGTLHLEPTLTLARACRDAGQRAFVAKVSMDRHGAEGYQEASAAEAVANAEHFIDMVHRMECAAGRE
eukprot:Hpha_TRINITY_DN849_c0_g2::TRINITY_DN849_c0_g2_i1::g.194960::m.194960/K01487/E3.5.4.3, guaD; guanine deaminase